MGLHCLLLMKRIVFLSGVMIFGQTTGLSALVSLHCIPLCKHHVVVRFAVLLPHFALNG